MRLFQLFEEGTVTQRAIVAGGLPEGGGFMAGEAGEAIAPGGRAWPVVLELASLELASVELGQS